MYAGDDLTHVRLMVSPADTKPVRLDNVENGKGGGKGRGREREKGKVNGGLEAENDSGVL